MKLPKNILNAKIFQPPKILKSKISNPPKNVNHPCHLQSGPIRSNPLEIYWVEIHWKLGGFSNIRGVAALKKYWAMM